MANIVLVRHAIAVKENPERYPDDFSRPLSDKGTAKFKKAARGLSKLIKADRVLTSQASRCIQTATLLEWDASWPAAVAYDTLDVDQSAKAIVDDVLALPEWPCTVALVSHGPNLQELLAYLVNGAGDVDREIDKGGAALIRIGTKLKPGAGSLVWLMSQKELKQHQ